MAQQNYQEAQTADAARQQAAEALTGAAQALGSAAGGAGTGDLNTAITQLQQGADQLQTGLAAYTDGVGQAAAGSAALADPPTACPPCRPVHSSFRRAQIPLVTGLTQLQSGTSQLAQLGTAAHRRHRPGGQWQRGSAAGTAVLRQGADHEQPGCPGHRQRQSAKRHEQPERQAARPTDGIRRLQQGTQDPEGRQAASW